MRALLLVLWICLTSLARAAQPVALPDPEYLFAATLSDLRGRPHALAGLRGKPLVVNFWARWCGPCKVEIPELIKVQRQYKAQGLVVVGIAIEDQVDSVREFARAYEMDYTVLVAREHGLPLMGALGNDKGGLPYTLVIDQAGTVLALWARLVTPAELSIALERLFPR